MLSIPEDDVHAYFKWICCPLHCRKPQNGEQVNINTFVSSAK